MNFVFSSATAAQNARRKLEQAGVHSVLRKNFNRKTGCQFVLSVSERDADVAEKLLQGGRI